MAKVEASLPLLAKEGWKTKMDLFLLCGHTTLSCGQVGQNKKINLKGKTKLAQRYWGVGLANHTPKV
jgi:hypothetical protein